MIVDSSALIAILRAEPDRDRLESELARANERRISAANMLETAIVVDGSRDPFLSAKLSDYVAEAGILVEPFTEEQAAIARQAYRDYGKSSGHAAGLNFGDCFAYALAKMRREPLLFKGEDFLHTDIRPALPLDDALRSNHPKA